MFEQTSPKWPNLDLQLFRFISSHMWLMIGQKVTELKKGNQGNQGNQATKEPMLTKKKILINMPLLI